MIPPKFEIFYFPKLSIENVRKEIANLIGEPIKLDSYGAFDKTALLQLGLTVKQILSKSFDNVPEIICEEIPIYSRNITIMYRDNDGLHGLEDLLNQNYP